jgi:hypothetical protein
VTYILMVFTTAVVLPVTISRFSCHPIIITRMTVM